MYLKVILCPYKKGDTSSVCYNSPYLYRSLFRLESGKLEVDPEMVCLKIAPVFQSMCKPYLSFFLNSPFFPSDSVLPGSNFFSSCEGFLFFFFNLCS